MLPLPKNDWSCAEVLASWLELSALAEANGFAARGAVMETLRDSMLFGGASATRDQDRDSSSEGSAASKLDEVWRVLEGRAALLGTAWPFALTAEVLERAAGKETIQPVAAYAAMILLEAATAKWFPRLTIAKGDPIRTLFEHVAAVAIGNLLKGKVVRFGAPFPRGWPSTFPAQVRHLAGEFAVRHRDDDISAHASPSQLDDSLDLVARMRIADEAEGSPYVLVQCATGANWKSAKPGEPRMELWNKYVSWNGPTYKALAIPFTLRKRGALADVSVRHGNAIVFDRLRLAAGVPDAAIDPRLKLKLIAWCRAKFNQLGTRQRSKPAGGATTSDP